MNQQTYGNYPYYSVYPQQTSYMSAPGPSSGYPPFYPPQPQPQPAPQTSNPPIPAPYTFDSAAYQPKNGRRPRKSSRKKHEMQMPVPQPTHNQSRPRVPSNPQNPMLDETFAEKTDNPFHMIVSFHGYNELHIEHILELALEEMRQVIWPLWPDRLESDVVVGHTCIARFRNTPWDLSGPDVQHAYKLIAEFFRLFQKRGYSFQTAINIGTTTPRLIFQVTKPDNSEFFLAFFSQEGRRLTLINPPQSIDLSIGARLRSVFGKQISSVDVPEEYMRVFEVKRKSNSNGSLIKEILSAVGFRNSFETPVSEVEPGIFLVEVLRVLNQLGFHLDASIPLGRRGPLSFRNRREILVFKKIIPGIS